MGSGKCPAPHPDLRRYGFIKGFSGGRMMKFNENYIFFEVIDLSLLLINIIYILQINSLMHNSASNLVKLELYHNIGQGWDTRGQNAWHGEGIAMGLVPLATKMLRFRFYANLATSLYYGCTKKKNESAYAISGRWDELI